MNDPIKLYYIDSLPIWRRRLQWVNKHLDAELFRTNYEYIIVSHTIFLYGTSPLFSRRHYNCIFLNENVWISINISLKFVLEGPISNIPIMVQIMAWRRSGDKPLSEPMLVNLLRQICGPRPQWVKSDLVRPQYAHHLSHRFEILHKSLQLYRGALGKSS